jgi:rubrerythrin
MAFETTKDVLDHAREFHTQLSDFYTLLSRLSEKQRVKLLLDYMSEHEKYLEETLTRYEEEVSKKILNTLFQYPPPKELLETCREVSINRTDELSVDDVIEIAVKLNQCLIDLYKEMIKNSETDLIREVFTNLMEMEKRQELELVRDAQEWKDL